MSTRRAPGPDPLARPGDYVRGVTAPRIADVAFAELLTLEPHGPDTYVGTTARYPWGKRLYGGQVVAQALRAASATVDPSRPAHSLHSYFIRPGTPDEPIRYEVERLRDGRSFSTRQVVARQSAGAILNISVSFQVVEDEADVQVVSLPDGLPGPDDPALVEHSWGSMLQRRGMPLEGRVDRYGFWIRLDSVVAEDPFVRQCALAFVSDAAPSRAARSPHPEAAGDITDRNRFQGASLDHAVWFHRPARADAWHLYDVHSLVNAGGRGVLRGTMHDVERRIMVSVAQEMRLRPVS